MDTIKIGILLFAVFTSSLILTQAAGEYKLCVTRKYADQCEQLLRGGSEVKCQIVQDSVECAKRLLNQTAHFGVFSAESTIHLAALGWEDVTVIKHLAHKDRQFYSTDFESVVIVKDDFKGGLEGLKGKKFCHPGLHYDKSHRWSEYFSKYFERTVITSPKCVANQSPAEIETAALASYFGKSCRPGKWSHDSKEDEELKRKYPSLCELCDPSSKNCDYPEGVKGPNRNHQKALNCLKQGGEVAYVSREDAEYFFKENTPDQYRYLCPNGTVETIANRNNPCVWLRQPWSVIIATREKAVDIESKLDIWLKNGKIGAWESGLKEILETDNFIPISIVMQLPSEFLRPFRKVPRGESLCNKEISWCTTSVEEEDKCKVIRTAGMTAGVYPYINCRKPLQDTMQCMHDISKDASDFMGIDSNYGFMARRLFNLTAAMYFETEVEQYSSVVVVTHAGSKYKKFQDLKGAKACLPEFGATPTISFINFGKELKFFKRDECRYGKLLKDFFGASCAPGANDMKRNLNKRDLNNGTNNQPEPLCALCLNEDLKNRASINIDTSITNVGGGLNEVPNKITCSAEEGNRYYGNRGALRCLLESGDIAIVELQSLKEHASYLGLEENKFQIICRNGSLAQPGFNVDLKCALTTVVDGEIVVRRNTTKLNWIIHALNAFDNYFQVGPDFKMYNIFDGIKHLLFKDSTIGLTSINEKAYGPTVENYIKLFKNTEDCVQGNSATNIIFNLTTTLILVLIAMIISQ